MYKLNARKIFSKFSSKIVLNIIPWRRRENKPVEAYAHSPRTVVTGGLLWVQGQPVSTVSSRLARVTE